MTVGSIWVAAKYPVRNEKSEERSYMVLNIQKVHRRNREDCRMVKNKTAKRIMFIVGAALCCIFAVILICNLTIIIKGIVNPKVPPSVFGITPMVVQSGSMSGSADDHIEVGDLIFTVRPETNRLKAGDIISYMDGNIAVTHRIIEVQTNSDGKRSFVTKGDANNTEDPAVSEDAVFGIYKGRIPRLGDFAMFLQKPLGMAVFIGISVCAFIIYDIIRRQRSSGRKDKETEELKAELERLRAASGKNDTEKEDGGTA